MSKLRPELESGYDPATPDETVLYLVREAVARRRGLIYGRLHDDRGRHCALGCLWADNPQMVVNTKLVDEIAAVNDSVPATASPRARWRKVSSWLRWKLRVLAARGKEQ